MNTPKIDTYPVPADPRISLINVDPVGANDDPLEHCGTKSPRGNEDYVQVVTPGENTQYVCPADAESLLAPHGLWPLAKTWAGITQQFETAKLHVQLRVLESERSPDRVRVQALAAMEGRVGHFDLTTAQAVQEIIETHLTHRTPAVRRQAALTLAASVQSTHPSLQFVLAEMVEAPHSTAERKAAFRGLQSVETWDTAVQETMIATATSAPDVSPEIRAAIAHELTRRYPEQESTRHVISHLLGGTAVRNRYRDSLLAMALRTWPAAEAEALAEKTLLAPGVTSNDVSTILKSRRVNAETMLAFTQILGKRKRSTSFMRHSIRACVDYICEHFGSVEMPWRLRMALIAQLLTFAQRGFNWPHQHAIDAALHLSPHMAFTVIGDWLTNRPERLSDDTTWLNNPHLDRDHAAVKLLVTHLMRYRREGIYNELHGPITHALASALRHKLGDHYYADKVARALCIHPHAMMREPLQAHFEDRVGWINRNVGETQGYNNDLERALSQLDPDDAQACNAFDE